MSRAELKAEAKKQISGKIGILFVMLIIVFAIGMVAAFIPIVGPCVGILITPSFSLSICMIYLAITKGEEIQVGDIFKGFNKMGKAIWLQIITNFFTALWTMLLIIPGIIKSYSYSMAFYILADNPELTAREALSKSKEIMNGHKFDLFVLHLSFIGWSLLTVITFGLVGIYVVPYMGATVANFYNSIKD